MTSLGLMLRRCGFSFYCTSLQEQLCGCSQKRGLIGQRRVARLLGQRQGLTTDDDRNGSLTGISLGGLWISSSVLLYHDAPWIVHRRGRSWVSDEHPFSRHAQPSVAAFSAAWPRCWWSPFAVTLKHLWRNCSSGCWGWNGDNVGGNVLGLAGDDCMWPTSRSRTGG